MCKTTSINGGGAPTGYHPPTVAARILSPIGNSLCPRQDGSEGWKATLTLAVLMSLTSMLQTFMVNQYFHILFRMSLHMKVRQTGQ